MQNLSSTFEIKPTPIVMRKQTLTSRVVELVIFSLPVIYLAIMFTVFIHEVLGHGLAAALLGGRFLGFGLSPDGMGWANVIIASLPVRDQILALFAGICSTTLLSVLALVFSNLCKKHVFASLGLLFLAMISLLDGLPYFFFDALHLAGHGDFSRIWQLSPDPLLRTWVIIVCGVGAVLVITLFNLRFYRMMYRHVADGGVLQQRGRILIAAIALLLQIIGWFSFDWNQLIPGIGLLPGFVGAGIAFMVLILLIFFSHPQDGKPQVENKKRQNITLGVLWLLGVGVLLAAVFWLQYGVSL